MSIVKYKNKKTGYITVYESSSFYDPVLKQSRPKRKYLGHEDPETGELIQSSGQPGRRKGSTSKKPPTGMENPELYDKALADIAKKDGEIQKLREENARLLTQVRELKAAMGKAAACLSPFVSKT